MMKFIAIPARLLRDDLTDEEKSELAQNYGEQPMTAEEISEREIESAAALSQQISSILIEATKDELNKSDMVAMRCFKAGVDFPQEWKNYTLSLRNIILNKSGQIPQRPNYPEGT